MVKSLNTVIEFLTNILPYKEKNWLQVLLFWFSVQLLKQESLNYFSSENIFYRKGGGVCLSRTCSELHQHAQVALQGLTAIPNRKKFNARAFQNKLPTHLFWSGPGIYGHMIIPLLWSDCMYWMKRKVVERDEGKKQNMGDPSWKGWLMLGSLHSSVSSKKPHVTEGYH